MSNWLGMATAISTFLIMFSLGLASPNQTPVGKWLWPMLRIVLGHNLLFPLLAWGIVTSMHWLAPGVALALLLCIVAAGGTSAGAFVIAAKGAPAHAARLIVILVGISVANIVVLSWTNVLMLGEFSRLALAGNLFGLTAAPLAAGSLLRRRAPHIAALLKPWAERLGGGLVIGLVLFLSVGYGPAIFAGPKEPFLAAAGLAGVLLFSTSFEPDRGERRTVMLVSLIRNLSLALWLASRLPVPGAVLPTLLVYGLMMYGIAIALTWYWRQATLIGTASDVPD